MKYAIVASAWLIAWGVNAPQQAAAGFVLSVADATIVEGCLVGAETGCRAVGVRDAGAPHRDQQELLSLLDQMLGVLQVPVDFEAPTGGSSRAPSFPVVAVVDRSVELLRQSHCSSQLPPESMFSVDRMFKSGVFRPPRA